MTTEVDVDVISEDPHEAFVDSLASDLSDSSGFKVVVGFLTQAGVNSIKAFLKANSSKLQKLVIGHAGRNALDALATLKRDLHLADDVLMIHLGRSTTPVASYAPNPYRPMMHSKIYYIEKGDSEVVAFVGSNNLTQWALGGANCEAAVRLQGQRDEMVFQKLRAHIDLVVKESVIFDPSDIDLYAAVNTRLITSMLDAGEEDTSLMDDPAIVLAAVRTKPLLPKAGEKLYFEVAINNEEYESYVPGKKIELYLLAARPSRDLREVVQKSFKCFEAIVTMVSRTGFQGTQGTPATPQTVDWVIEGAPPTLIKRSKFRSPSKALQVLAVFGSELHVKWDYFRSAPPLRFTSELDREQPVRLRAQILSGQDHPRWKPVPPEVIEALSPYLDENWFLVREVVREAVNERPLLTDTEDQFVWHVKYQKLTRG